MYQTSIYRHALGGVGGHHIAKIQMPEALEIPASGLSVVELHDNLLTVPFLHLPVDLSDLVLPLEESPRSWASEAVQITENTGDRPGRESSTNRLFVPREPDLTDPQEGASKSPFYCFCH